MGQVSVSQMAMMKEMVRTVGISAVLDTPKPPATSQSAIKDGPPSALSRAPESASAPNANAHDVLQRGSKRDATHNFDIGIEAIYAVGDPKEAHEVFETRS